jgi:DNA repair photolyase
MVLPYIRKDFFVCPDPIYMDVYSKCEYECRYCYIKISEGTYRKQQCSKPIHSVIQDTFEADLHKMLDNPNCAVTRLIRQNNVPVMLSGKCEPFCPFEFTNKSTQRVCKALHEQDVPIAFETKGILEGILPFIKDINAALNITIIPGTDDQCRSLEPYTPIYSKRFQWAKELRENGIWVGVKAEPIIANFNSSKDTILKWVNDCASANVCHVSFHDMRLEPSQIVALSNNLEAIGVSLAKVVEGYRTSWDEIANFTFDALKSAGLKVSSPDWVRFGTKNSCQSCCGLDTVFGAHRFNYQYATKLLATQPVSFSDLVKENVMGKPYEYSFEDVWNDPKCFRLCDVKGVKVISRDEKNRPIFGKCENNGGLTKWK